MSTPNPLNSVRGPANVWVASFGATEPAQTNAALIADPSSPWTFIGTTQGGVSWADQQTVEETDADQLVDSIGGHVTKRKTIMTFNMLEVTVANLAVALNNFGTVNVGTGITVYDPGSYDGGSIPTYSAILVDGQAPQVPGGGKARRRTVFRKVMNTGAKVEQVDDSTKDKVFAFSGECFWVSTSLRPWIMMDQTA